MLSFICALCLFFWLFISRPTIPANIREFREQATQTVVETRQIIIPRADDPRVYSLDNLSVFNRPDYQNSINALRQWKIAAHRIAGTQMSNLGDLHTTGNIFLNAVCEKIAINPPIARSNANLVQAFFPDGFGSYNNKSLGNYVEAALATLDPDVRVKAVVGYLYLIRHLPDRQ